MADQVNLSVDTEVTPAMIEAGRRVISAVWLDFTGPSGHVLWDEVLTKVFRAMSGARPE